MAGENKSLDERFTTKERETYFRLGKASRRDPPCARERSRGETDREREKKEKAARQV